MTRQEQTTASGAEAYQAAGDIIVYKGISVQQMEEILFVISEKMQRYADVANNLFEERASKLRQELLLEFTEKDGSANPEAMKDPDFQYVVGQATESFGRSGDSALLDQLIKLISMRSIEITDSRKSIILNRAIEIASRISPKDRANLVVLFVSRNVMIHGLNKSAVIQRYMQYIERYIDLLPFPLISYKYLESVGCVTINNLISYNMYDIISENYMSILYRPFSFKDFLDEQLDLSGDYDIRRLNGIVRGVGEGNCVFNFENAEELNKFLIKNEAPQKIAIAVMGRYSNSICPPTQVKDEFLKVDARFGRYFDCMNSKPAISADITAVGMALALASLKAEIAFDASIDNWLGDE